MNTQCIPFEFTEASHPRGVRIPKGIRVFQIGDEVVRVPGNSEGSTRIFVHPDDIQKIQEANP